MFCQNSPREGGVVACFFFLFCLLGLLAFSPSTSNSAVPTRETPRLPAEYGRIIFQKNDAAESQIYIIGQAHRSANNGKNGEETVQTQLEIFRIGEWLIKTKEVELLLPEGFFRKIPTDSGGMAISAVQRKDVPSPDDAILRQKLVNTDTFVSADTLLKANYNLCLGQVEDERLYRKVALVMRRVGDNQGEVDPALYKRLSFFQTQRTAVMLQKIPTVTEEVFQRGAIRSKSAIFTIGVSHVSEIVGFLKKGRVDSSFVQQGGSESLELLDKDFGVTVILPKTLAEDERVLRLTRLFELTKE